MDKLSEEERMLLGFLEQYVTAHKQEEIERVLKGRTRKITVVLENIYQAQNSSAAIRSCECFGIQDVHLIENTASYAINPKVLKGSNKWLTLHRYKNEDKRNTEYCFQFLKEHDYHILCLDPVPGCTSLFELDPGKAKVALVFGNELEGLSPEALDGCDEKLTIPMTGFTESLNISATVSACLTWLNASWRTKEKIDDFLLSAEEMDQLRLQWYRKILKRSDALERAFKKRMTTNF